MSTNKKGFTLVEILIVVVILGILAAIVIPQFTNASTEAKESRIAADLQTLRSQIELFKIQHSDVPPDVNSSAEFASDLTTQGTDGYGPYMQVIPTNPFVTTNANVVEIDGTLGNGSHGWNFNSTTNVLRADDADHDDL